MKEILLKLVEFYELLDPIDKAAIVMLILLILVCVYAYFDIRKLDKRIDEEVRFIEKKYGRLK
jgi:hypothetical protein